ncbi:MAG: class I tRNA ligase family protein, partial [Firmicutes bacterium]|nr:class I tRNA ligase family protein [Bacillota bacterium]
MFIGDYEKSAPWSDNGAKGCRRFLDRVWKLQDMVVEEAGYGKALESAIHKTIKKVNDDYEEMKYNTAIAALMTLVNEFNREGAITGDAFKTFLQLLYPVAPHITSEIWQNMQMGGALDDAAWPQYDEAKTVDNVIEMAVQINGKVRGTITIPVDADKDEAKAIALAQENILAYIQGKTIVKEIYVPGKIFNIVVK